MSPSTTRALNEAQSRAVQALEGPVLVIAGAGTGKTHTLVHRLVRLVEGGVPPRSILLLTFTRRAAEEMIARAGSILGREEPVSGGTFHSFAHRTLRRHGAEIGLETNFTILDQADTFEILGGIRSELKSAGVDLPRRETLAGIISKAVNKQAPIEDVVASEYAQFFELASYIDVVASRYESYKQERNLVDFDNLLVLAIRLLEESDRARERVHESYRYLMVDEYQDTNVLQARLTHLLAGPARNVMVVGDDAQSIYAFRGANHRNLFDFHAAFDDATVVTLEENYRSRQPVLDVANGIMAQMSEAFRKRLFTNRGGGERPYLVEAADEEEQAALVADEVGRLASGGVPLSEIAVLFRASRQAFALEIELQRRSVPYVKYGGFRFMESAHIKDVLAHLRLVAFPNDDLSLGRVLLMREGIGRKGAAGIQEAVRGRPIASALRAYPARGRVEKSLDALASLVDALEAAASDPAAAMAAAIEGYDPILKTRFDDWPRRKRDLETLAGLVTRYRSLRAMLSELTLDPPTASRGEALAGEGGRPDELVLSTMHSSKGLEWRVVFVIQARDGYIPMVMGFDDDPDDELLDEERRLLYVAVTRAKDRLYVLWPRETARGRYAWPMPSRFLTELPEDAFELRDAASLGD